MLCKNIAGMEMFICILGIFLDLGDLSLLVLVDICTFSEWRGDCEGSPAI